MIVAAGVALSIAALALRTVGPFGWVVAVCGGAVAFVVPTSRIDVRRATWVLSVAAGTAAVLVVRLVVAVPVSATRWGIVAAVVAGVAEEAIFRRGLYGLLERWGALLAVTGSATAFALVHVPLYGWRVVWLDLAAGLVFGWQRWASGHWSAPAITHAMANVVAHV